MKPALPLDIESVQDLIGKPYQRGARGPDAYDCWGLCVEVYRRGGIDLPDFREDHMTHERASQLMADLAHEHAEWIRLPENWCFAYDPRGHIGLFWGGYVLHSARGCGAVLQRSELFRMAAPCLLWARWRQTPKP